jgi:hypothetical protein
MSMGILAGLLFVVGGEGGGGGYSSRFRECGEGGFWSSVDRSVKAGQNQGSFGRNDSQCSVYVLEGGYPALFLYFAPVSWDEAEKKAGAF